MHLAVHNFMLKLCLKKKKKLENLCFSKNQIGFKPESFSWTCIPLYHNVSEIQRTRTVSIQTSQSANH